MGKAVGARAELIKPMLAILTTHPIQYQIPLWRMLARETDIPFEVWYCSDQGARSSYDPEFRKEFAWDIDMLTGYPYRFLPVSPNPKTGNFLGMRLSKPIQPTVGTARVRALWVNGWQVYAYWQAIFQATRFGIPVWMRGESNDLAPIPRWKQPIKRAALGVLFHRISNFLFIGSANRRLYQSLGVEDSRLYSAPYAVDNDRFAAAAAVDRPNRQAIRAGWNIDPASFCIVFVGKFIPKKRPLDVIEAAKRLTKERGLSKIHLLLVGSGELDNELRAACDVVYDHSRTHGTAQGRSIESRPRASFAGFLNQQEICKAYVAADCLVLPSDHGETWGLVVNEALATGLTCVVSDACGCGEDLITPIDPRLRFPMGNVDALASALRIANASRFDMLRIRPVLEQFSFSRTKDTVNDLYRSLVAGPNHKRLWPANA